MACHFLLFFSADINDLFDVHYELLNVSHNWRGVGGALRLHPDLLNRIGADHFDVKSRLNGVLTEWLKKAYDTSRFGQPSWEVLVVAVAHPAGGNDCALAEAIARRHNGKGMPKYMYTCVHNWASGSEPT